MLKHIEEAVRKEGETIVLHGAEPVTREGFGQEPKFILRHPRLSLGAKVTYSAMLGYAWQKDSAFPGQATLGKELGVTDRHVRRFISELKQEGLLRVERRGLGKTNRYHLYMRVVDKRVTRRA